MLTLTILGYTVCSLATAATHSAWSFGLVQLAARVFLLGEWAEANVMAAEEFPADRRGTVIGVIQASASLGAIVCAGLVPLMVRSPLGWRTVYVAGAIPLVLTAFARRNLQETRRFREQGAGQAKPSPLALLRGPYGRRIWQLGFCGR